MGEGRSEGRLFSVLSSSSSAAPACSASSTASGASRAADRVFVTRDQFAPGAQVFVPTFVFCAAHAVARSLRRKLPARRGVHAFRRSIAWWKSLVTASCSRRDVRHVRHRVRCHHAEGAARSAVRPLSRLDGSLRTAAARLSRPADVSKTLALMLVGLVLGIFVGVLPGPGRPERRGDTAAAHVHDGSDVGDRHAVVHLLGRALRGRDHLDPFQYSR